MSTLLALFETSGIIDTITSVIGTLLYPLFSIIFVLIQGVQAVFYAFAGIGTSSFDGTPIYAGNTGAENDTGLLYYLLNEPLVKNMLISIAILGVFLVIIFTVMAFIKNIYSAKPKGWKDIIANSIKGLANFIFLPVCVLLGVWLGNILLQAINGATSNGGAISMERKLFIASAYNANLYRTGNATGRDLAYEAYSEAYGAGEADSNVPEGLKDEEYAEILDKVYVESNIDIHAWWTVGRHYSLWQVNYIILIVGGIFMLYVLGSITFAMVKRLIYIIILFIVSPGVCAMYPLDEGNAVKSWSGEVKKQVLSAYGAVAGMNLFYSILPLLDKISIFESGWFGMDDIVQIFIMVTGLLVVKDLIGLISGFVGGDNALATGSSLMKSAAKEVGGRAGKYVKNTASAFSRAAGAFKEGGFKAGAKSLFVDSIGKGILSSGNNALKTLTGIDVQDTFNTAKNSVYQGRNAAKEAADIKTKGKYGEKEAANKASNYMSSVGTGNGRASKLFSKFNDSMKKVNYSNVKGDASFTNLGIDTSSMKQEEAMEQVTTIDNLLDMLDKINAAAGVAATSRSAVDALGSSLTGDDKTTFDTALREGRTLRAGEISAFRTADISTFNNYIIEANRVKSAQDRFNQYAESHSDVIESNSKASEMVEKVQANISSQQSSGVYKVISDDTVGAKALKTASDNLATALNASAGDTKGNARKAKDNAGKDSAKNSK